MKTREFRVDASFIWWEVPYSSWLWDGWNKGLTWTKCTNKWFYQEISKCWRWTDTENRVALHFTGAYCFSRSLYCWKMLIWSCICLFTYWFILWEYGDKEQNFFLFFSLAILNCRVQTGHIWMFVYSTCDTNLSRVIKSFQIRFALLSYVVLDWIHFWFESKSSHQNSRVCCTTKLPCGFQSKPAAPVLKKK